MAGTESKHPSVGFLLDEIKEGTDHEISLAKDVSDNLDSSARRVLAVEIGQSKGQSKSLFDQAQLSIAEQIGESKAANRNLDTKARQAITSESFAAQGTAALLGLIPQPSKGPSQLYIPPSGSTSCVPPTPPPSGLPEGLCPRPVCDPATGEGQGWEVVACPQPPGGGPAGGIDNVPIGPGPICPPPPKPAPCPVDPCTWTIWKRPCNEGTDTCVYALPAGMNPLGLGDAVCAGMLDELGGPVCRELSRCNEGCGDAPIGYFVCGEKPPPPPPPAGGGGGVCPAPNPAMPGQCGECPPGFHAQLGPNGVECVPDAPGMPPPPNCPPGTMPVWMPVGPGAGPADGSWNCIPKPAQPTPDNPTPPPAPTPVVITPPSTVTVVFNSEGGIGQPFPGNIARPAAAAAVAAAGDLCKDWDIWAAQYAGLDAIGVLKQEDILDQDGDLSPLKKAINPDDWPPYLQWLAKAIISFVQLPFIFYLVVWANLVMVIQKAVCANPAAMVATAIYRGSLTWVGRLIGAKSRQADRAVEKRENYLCPSETPGVAEANAARQTNVIDKEEWRCWVRMANLHEEYAEKVYYAERELLSPMEYVVAKNRAYISDDDLDLKLSRRGILDKADRQLQSKLGEFLPPVTDVLHFIIRGIADQALVQRFQLADEFDTLYAGDLVKWGEAAGVKKEVMKAYHEAHWVVPSPGQVFTMLQRLRPDNKPDNVPADKWEVTADDVSRALRENAYAPFWRPRLEQIAYNPITRRDLLQVYQRGNLTDQEFVARVRDLGYKQAEAELIAATYKARILDAIRKEEWTKLYGESAVTRADAIEQLVAQGYTEELINKALDWEDNVADAKTRIDCLKWLEKQYALGGLSDAEANQVMLEAGLDTRQTIRLLTQWSCRRKSRVKEVAAGMLCRWYARGYIQPTEILARLMRIGYEQSDAQRMVSECLAEVSDKQLAARQKEMKAQQSAAIRAGRAGAYQAKQLALAQAAQVKALAKQLSARTKSIVAQEREAAREASQSQRAALAASRLAARAQSAEDRLEAKLQVASEQFAGRAGIDSGLTGQWITDSWQTLQQKYGLDPTTALEAATLAAHDKRAVDQASYQNLVDQAGQAAATIERIVSPLSSQLPTGTTPVLPKSEG